MSVHHVVAWVAADSALTAAPAPPPAAAAAPPLLFIRVAAALVARAALPLLHARSSSQAAHAPAVSIYCSEGAPFLLVTASSHDNGNRCTRYTATSWAHRFIQPFYFVTVSDVAPAAALTFMSYRTKLLPQPWLALLLPALLLLPPSTGAACRLTYTTFSPSAVLDMATLLAGPAADVAAAAAGLRHNVAIEG